MISDSRGTVYTTIIYLYLHATRTRVQIYHNSHKNTKTPFRSLLSHFATLFFPNNVSTKIPSIYRQPLFKYCFDIVYQNRRYVTMMFIRSIPGWSQTRYNFLNNNSRSVRKAEIGANTFHSLLIITPTPRAPRVLLITRSPRSSEVCKISP